MTDEASGILPGRIFSAVIVTVTKLEKEVRFLKARAIVATLPCAASILTAFTMQGRKQRFGEIDVERKNIVEKDGQVRLAIPNKEIIPYGIVKLTSRWRRGSIHAA